jgi:hypothetical protein
VTLQDVFIGGTAVRILVFAVGLHYCLRRRGDRGVALSHVGSIVVLCLLPVSRELATFIGIPVTLLVVDRLTAYVDLKQSVSPPATPLDS